MKLFEGYFVSKEQGIYITSGFQGYDMMKIMISINVLKHRFESNTAHA